MRYFYSSNEYLLLLVSSQTFASICTFELYNFEYTNVFFVSRAGMNGLPLTYILVSAGVLLLLAVGLWLIIIKRAGKKRNQKPHRSYYGRKPDYAAFNALKNRALESQS